MLNGYKNTLDFKIDQMVQGNIFVLSGDTTILAGASLYFHIAVDGIDTFILDAGIVSAGGEVLVQGFSDSTVSSVGTPISVVNANRQAQDTPMTKVYMSPTVVSEGTVVSHSVSYANTQGNKVSLAAAGSNQIYLLKKNSSNLFKLTNRDTSSAKVSFNMTILESEI